MKSKERVLKPRAEIVALLPKPKPIPGMRVPYYKGSRVNLNVFKEMPPREFVERLDAVLATPPKGLVNRKCDVIKVDFKNKRAATV